MKKKIICIFLLTFVVFLLSACGAEKDETVSKTKIREDVIANQTLEKDGVVTKSFSIIKRQTNIQEKEDIIWVEFIGENDTYEIARCYKVTYVLYNEGWQMENLEDYEDETHSNYVQVKEDMPKEILEKYTSKEFLMSEESFLIVEEMGSYQYSLSKEETNYYYHYWGEDFEVRFVEAGGKIHEENYAEEEYYFDLVYRHDHFDEIIRVPIHFVFSESAEGTWRWCPTVYANMFERRLVFNEGIVGKWVSNSGYYEIQISDYEENECTVSSYVYHSPEGETYAAEGTMRISWGLNKNSGEISYANMDWVTLNGAEKKYCCEPDLSGPFQQLQYLFIEGGWYDHYLSKE